ncbi:Major facilitator, sugar transporter-like [Dillenia turbinata]|uniref:Major facilitator, sugar transporter-like n=1 Tax=Dillenia turbinata TaxID=194707 RepID=A0AAN8ZA43_9MAGN
MAPGALNIGCQLSITIDILVANVLNYFFAKIKGGWEWRLSIGGAVDPALISLSLSLGSLSSDTPNSMIKRGQFEGAKKKLIKIRASEASNPWTNLLETTYRPHLTMAMLIPLFQQLIGINVIMFYTPICSRPSVIGLVNVFATLVSIYGVDKWGRRFLFLEGGTQMLICLIAVAAFIGAKFGVNGEPGELPKGYAIVVGHGVHWGGLSLVRSSHWKSDLQLVNMIFTFLIAQSLPTNAMPLEVWPLHLPGIQGRRHLPAQTDTLENQMPV